MATCTWLILLIFVVVSSFDHPHIIEGHGTVGLEIMEQLPLADAVLVPVGGGGLITGVAIAIKHLKPDTEIYVSTYRNFIKWRCLFLFTIIEVHSTGYINRQNLQHGRIS